MAFETVLVAIRQREGKFDVASDTIADINLDALRTENRISDVSDKTGYVDRAAILSYEEFPKYFLPESNPRSKAAREWYAELPKFVQFIIVNEAEWESGLGE